MLPNLSARPPSAKIVGESNVTLFRFVNALLPILVTLPGMVMDDNGQHRNASFPMLFKLCGKVTDAKFEPHSKA